MTTAQDIQAMFKRIAGKYDFFNRFFSLGLEIWWRRVLLQKVLKGNFKTILDLATGTGKISIPLQKKGMEVTGVDFCAEMLEIAEKKGLKNIVQADITKLPFPDDSFDAATIGFAMRNLEEKRLEALKEIRRVLKPEGKLFVLEFSKPHAFIRPLFYFYIKHIMPWVVYVLTRQKNAYDYLASSVEAFLNQEEFKKLMEEAGFQNVEYENLSMGTVAIHWGQK